MTTQNIIKKELKKLILKGTGTHLSSVKNYFATQYPSYDIAEYMEFINNCYKLKFK